MKIYKTRIIVFDEAGNEHVQKCDTIAFEGDFWLVPEWRETEPGCPEVPTRLVGFSSLPHSAHIGNPVGDFALQAPLTTRILDGKLNEHEKKMFRIVEAPTLSDIEAGQTEH